MLTFDDGHDDHHRYVLPMLAERGLTGTFFILARDPAEGLTVAHRIHVLLACMSAGELRDVVFGALPPADRSRYLQAELDHALTPFDDPVDDVKWVLQRDLMDVAGPVLSRLVEELVGPETEVAEALHLDARQTGSSRRGHDPRRPHPRPSLDGLAVTGGVRARDRGIGSSARGARPARRLAVRVPVWGCPARSRRPPATRGLPGCLRGHGHQPQ